MLVLTRSDVEAVLDADELIAALADGFVDLSSGRASVPLRIAAFTPDGLLGAMPAYLPSADALTIKLVTLFEGNADTELPTHQAAIAVFDPKRGNIIALMDGTWITAARTAAGSALSTQVLAREDARVLTIVGTGVQARSHAWALRRARAFEEVRVVGRNRAKADAVAVEFDARAFDSLEEAVADADVVCATTSSSEPVVRREWLAPGVHVTSVGQSSGRELDEQTVIDALVIVDSRAALKPFPIGANDLSMLGDDDVHELGEVIAGDAPGRTAADQLTLYKSVGNAAMDAAAAALVLRAARQRGIGQDVEL
jgi:ornithine cyclodeaminase